MSLPPEQISIKRRREEEPPETLYIQSELHQTKRRFTDFVFQRVQISGNSVSPGPASSLSVSQRTIRSPRSVSSLHVAKTKRDAVASGVPTVRATSPGAEFREEKRLAAVRKEAEEKLKRALQAPSISTATTSTPAPGPAEKRLADQDAVSTTPRDSSPGSTPLRRFQISRSSTPANSHLLRSTGGGVQKRRDGVAVLVEKLRRTPHSRQASMVADAALGQDDTPVAVAIDEVEKRPRKRPVVNKAEKQWREQRKSAISAAKENISQTLEKESQAHHQSNWDDESERLAREFEQIALELEGGAMEEDVASPIGTGLPYPPPSGHSVMPKAPPLKYKPRTPNKHRQAQGVVDSGALGKEGVSGDGVEQEEESDDGEYVYDTYIRRPLADGLTNPLVALEQDQTSWLQEHGVDTTRQDIGVIVITQEDEEYWEHFVVEDEDGEDRWDSEDGDSNAENNPANEYPDEDLSWDDEEDDPSAAYSRYRRHAVSDDEEYDLAGSFDEKTGQYGYGYGYQPRGHVDSDDESW